MSCHGCSWRRGKGHRGPERHERLDQATATAGLRAIWPAGWANLIFACYLAGLTGYSGAAGSRLALPAGQRPGTPRRPTRNEPARAGRHARHAVAVQVLDVLLVEDAPGDVLLAKEAFEQSAISSQLHVTADGDQAIGFLRRTGPYASAPRPGLILLDLNLPRRGGPDQAGLASRERQTVLDRRKRTRHPGRTQNSARAKDQAHRCCRNRRRRRSPAQLRPVSTPCALLATRHLVPAVNTALLATRRLRYHTTAGPPEPDGGRTETRRRSALTAAGSPAGCSALRNPRAGVTA